MNPAPQGLRKLANSTQLASFKAILWSIFSQIVCIQIVTLCKGILLNQ